LSIDRRRQLVDSGHASLSIARQCELVAISRSGFYYQPSGETELNLGLMRLIDEQHLRTPYYGARQMARLCVYRLATSTRLFLQRMSQNLAHFARSATRQQLRQELME
jgi:hypothetical protein